jgi:transcriptional regulator GlxA family with amidase domain
VIGAQSDNTPELLAWLRQQHADGATLLSMQFGQAAAQATADYMEYQGRGWLEPE